MPGRDSIITTEADALINLLKIKGEISLEEAAKELNMNIKTVEEYANFFEEEGLIKITYRFTTPYLSLKEKKEEIPEIKFSPEEESYEIKNLKNAIETLKLKVKSGEIYTLKTLLPKVLNELREEFKRAERPTSILDSIKKEYEIAKEALDNNQESLAREKFSSIEKQISKLYKELYRIPENNLNQLIKRASELIDKGDFEAAKKVYDKLEEEYTHLPEDYRKKMNLLKEQLVMLSSKLSERIKQKYSEDMKNGSDIIKKHIRTALHYLNNNELSEAIKEFNKIKEVYYLLPKGFVDKKIELNQLILEAYEKISKARNEYLEKKFNEIAGIITDKIEEIRKALIKKDFNACIRNYNLAIEYFNKLPDINMPVKKNLKNYLILVYEKLSSAKMEYFNKFLKKEIERINYLIKEARELIEIGEIDKAKERYDKIIEIYKSLPEGYTYEIVPTQKRINELFRLFSKKLDEEARRRFNEDIDMINHVLSVMQDEVKNENYEEALKQYEKAMILYNNLPKGFFKEKTELQQEIIRAYKDMVKRMDDMVLKDEDQEIRDLYHKFLMNVVLFYMHLEAQDLKLAEIDYRHITEIFEKLPFGLLKKSKLIKKEMAKISREIAIIRNIRTIETYIEMRDFEKAAALWKQTHKLFSSLAPEEPDVRGLFRMFDKLLVLKPKTPVPKPEMTKTVKPAVKEKDIKPIKPLTKEEDASFRKLASKKKLGKEFEELRKILETNVIDTLYSKKKRTFIRNRIDLAKALIKIKRYSRAEELLKDVLKIDPNNKTALELLKNGQNH